MKSDFAVASPDPNTGPGVPILVSFEEADADVTPAPSALGVEGF